MRDTSPAKHFNGTPLMMLCKRPVLSFNHSFRTSACLSLSESFKPQKIHVQTQLQIGELAITCIRTNKNIIDCDKIWSKQNQQANYNQVVLGCGRLLQT